MIWNKEKQHFNWLFVILFVYCAFSLLAFDLVWRIVNIGMVKLLLLAIVSWLVGAAAIYFTCRKDIVKGT